jgi:hypothetical protein
MMPALSCDADVVANLDDAFMRSIQANAGCISLLQAN